MAKQLFFIVMMMITTTIGYTQDNQIDIVPTETVPMPPAEAYIDYRNVPEAIYEEINPNVPTLATDDLYREPVQKYVIEQQPVQSSSNDWTDKVFIGLLIAFFIAVILLIFIMIYEKLNKQPKPISTIPTRPTITNKPKRKSPPVRLRLSMSDILAKHEQGKGLLLGVTKKGALRVSRQQLDSGVCHFLVGGKTGSGKTRFVLKPMILSALLDGSMKVILINRSNNDFWMFEGHHNCVLHRMNDASEAVKYLSMIYDEIQLRLNLLETTRCSTWGHYMLKQGESADSRIFVVFDEYNNLADSLFGAELKTFWKYTRKIANEGRKCGVHMTVAVQNPTKDGIDLSYRRAATPICLKVRDRFSSQAMLQKNGAEELGKREFYTDLGEGVIKAKSFNPDDEFIEKVIRERADEAPMLSCVEFIVPTGDEEDIDWIDDDDSQPKQKDSTTQAELDAATIIQHDLIKPFYAKSRAKILDYLYENGAVGLARNTEGYQRIDDAIRWLANNGTPEQRVWAKSVRGYPFTN